jgi:protein-S-isoprenylcysteine O-methyltransferase Ste14
MNSKFLVSVQFFSIFVILYPKQSITLTNLWWILIIISSITALWIFTHNKVGNFNITPEIKDNAKLVITGPYKFVRHPMYSSLILFMLGIVLYHFNWINLLFLIIMTLAVLIKAFKEEKLWHINSDFYHEYKKSTKMIIPFII